MDRKMCRHCGLEIANRPRGLGWKCFYNLAIRNQYQSESKFGRRSDFGDFNGKSKEPVPTKAMPMTEEKLAVLSARATAGEALHHPKDSRYLLD